MREKSHPLHEDVLALLCGSILVAVGLALFKSKGLVSPGAAGLSMVLDAYLPLNFGQLFFLINLPFYFLGIRDLGWEFTIKTLISVTVLAVLVQYMPYFIQFQSVSFLFASVVGGICIGFGVLAMFRHNASLGGVGILAFYLQKKFGISAGKFQMVVDACIVSMSFFINDFNALIFSVLGTFVLNLFLALNHKEGRYQIT